ncbi:MAG: hypothetical protein RLZZ271_88 [Pseudomonadota bacterium]|jgi:iron complex outermembrane receptor protein
MTSRRISGLRIDLLRKPMAVALAFVPVAALAAPSSQLDQLLEMRLEDLAAVKVSAVSKTTESALAAPAPVHVVTADDIRSFGWRTLGEALRTLPGLQVSYDRQYQYLGVRGINRHDFNSRVLVLIDGRRTNESVYDQGFIEEAFLLDMEAIERIEFVSGPGSALYGNNAMLGVVNVVTRKAQTMGGTRMVSEVASRSASRLYLEHGRMLEGGAQWSLNGSVSERKGGDLFFPERAGSNQGMARQLDGQRVQKVFGQYSSGEWRVQAGVSERLKHDPTALFGSVFADTAAMFSDRQIFASISREMRLSANAESYFQLARNGYHYTNRFTYSQPNPDTLNAEHTRGDWWQAEARMTYTGWKDHRLIVGLELQSNTRQDYESRDEKPVPYANWQQNGSARSAGLYVDDLYTLNSRWQVEFGARLDQYRLQSSIASCDLGNVPECSISRFDAGTSHVSPRAALIYRPAAQTVLKLMAGRAYRAPNPSELGYFTNTGAPMVGRAVPERFASREASLEHFVHPNWKIWGNAFNYELKGMIGRDASETYVNLNDIASSGLLLGTEWKDGRDATLRASVSHGRARDVRTGARLDDAPVNLLRLNYAFNLPYAKWRAGFELQSHGSRLNASGRRVDGATLANLTLSSAKLFAQGDVSVSFYNLFGRRYADPTGSDQTPIEQVAQDGRAVRLQMEWRF